MPKSQAARYSIGEEHGQANGTFEAATTIARNSCLRRFGYGPLTWVAGEGVAGVPRQEPERARFGFPFLFQTNAAREVAARYGRRP